MKKNVILFFIVATFVSCGVINNKFSATNVLVNDVQISNQIQEAIPELLKQNWLSAYLAQNDSRPVVICGQLSNDTESSLDIDQLYDALDVNLISSGKIRVLKSTGVQRVQTAQELLESQNIRFVVTLNIIPNIDQKAAECIYKVWGKDTSTPVGSVTKFIQIGSN